MYITFNRVAVNDFPREIMLKNIGSIFKMATNHKCARDALQNEKTHCADSRSDAKQKSAKKNILNSINSAIFAMLIQRTTFAVVLILLSFLSAPVLSESADKSAFSPIVVLEKISVEENAVDSLKRDHITILSPVYIPLTEPSPSPDTMTTTERGSKIEEDFGRSFANKTFETGNQLWDGFLNECMAKPSVSCIQKNVYSYLDASLGVSGDVSVTEGFVFKKNGLSSWKYSEKANKKNEDNTVDGGDDGEDFEDEARHSESPLEEVTDALYGKGISFLMGHDLELRLPQMLFGGATLKVSPRSLDGDGAIVRLDLEPREQGEGRIFFKKIKKYIKSKLLMAILAIVVIVKLIKLKLFVFMPLLMGVHNAKKLFLKFLLFVFPALSHIFKLCSWYHNNYHSTKYHHHHHQISHLHHTIPHVPSFSPHHVEHQHPPLGGHYPPSGVPESGYQLDQPDWQLSGPGLGPEYIGSSDVHRNIIAHNPRPDDMAAIKSWGLVPPPGQQASGSVASPVYGGPYSPYFGQQQELIRQAEANRKPQGPPLTAYASMKRNVVNPAVEKEALIRAAQKQEQLRLAQAQADEALRKRVNLQQQQQQQQHQQQLQQKQQQLQQLLLQQQQQKQQQQISSYVTIPPSQGGSSSPVYDSFYTPILQSVDKVLIGLSFYNEPCRERLICSMYKDPLRYSPHSNLVSNELSRDATELQKPTPGSPDAVRFYKYVQAARDGQEKKDCHQVYAQCSVDTEKRKKKK